MTTGLRQIPDLVALDGALIDVRSELLGAMERFAPFNSPHEGCAVIREELEELWEHAKANTGRDYEAYVEARQIAAMAVRYMLDLTSESNRDSA